mmetsp:Transcript_4462/g.11933  ORF Transcript_4462/g.11933 Transcript_4462/m.11933 type:complete len:289 (+) Transcript_4462:740-1606(+)
MGSRPPDVHASRDGGATGRQRSGLLHQGSHVQLQGRFQRVLYAPGCLGHDRQHRLGGDLPPPDPRRLQGEEARGEDGGVGAPLPRGGPLLQRRGRRHLHRVGHQGSDSGGAGRDALCPAGLLREARARGRRHAALLPAGVHDQRRRPPGHRPALPRWGWGRGLRRSGPHAVPGPAGAHGHAHLGLPLLGARRVGPGRRHRGGRVRWGPGSAGGGPLHGVARSDRGVRDLHPTILDLRILCESARGHLQWFRASPGRCRCLQSLGRWAARYGHRRDLPALFLQAAKVLQ